MEEVDDVEGSDGIEWEGNEGGEIEGSFGRGTSSLMSFLGTSVGLVGASGFLREIFKEILVLGDSDGSSLIRLDFSCSFRSRFSTDFSRFLSFFFFFFFP